MSLKQAAFTVHHLFQNIIPCNYFVDIEQDFLYPHPLYKQRSHQVFRCSAFICAAIGLPVTFVCIYWNFANMKSDFEENYIL